MHPSDSPPNGLGDGAPEHARVLAEGAGSRDHDWNYRDRDWWYRTTTTDWVGTSNQEDDAGRDRTGTDDDTSGTGIVTKPLTDIIVLKQLLAGGDDTRCQVQYLDQHVEIPPVLLAELGITAMPGQPPSLPATRIVQVMAPGDRLWPPHDDVVFERVDASGPFAVFSRTSAADPKQRTEHVLELSELETDGGELAPTGGGRFPVGRTRHVPEQRR